MQSLKIKQPKVVVASNQTFDMDMYYAGLNFSNSLILSLHNSTLTKIDWQMECFCTVKCSRLLLSLLQSSLVLLKVQFKIF